ncbi:uncharacterized protein LOC121379753 [Gigantopelta aegis]|uniref:uncharacterized protein LOC121379753 n=1 Tax=Gigantopelta aegis TaxID=1735272 RepID=UPI001B88DA56|nr:uncharacterized protein LOC121379753 [Gigantopelta aegis]
MKAAWKIINEEYPHITPIGCAAHGLSLLLGDVMKLQTMQMLFKKAKKVVKYVRVQQIISATFSQKQMARKKSTSLKLPSKTRWGAVVIMYKSLLDGKESLQELAIMELVEIDATIRNILLDNVFWAYIVSSLKVLNPIASAITQIEGDSSLLSDVPRHFKNLKEKLTIALPQSPLQKQEENDTLTFIENREEFCLKPIHAAANMLDPKCHGDDLDNQQISSAYEVISAMAHHLELDEGRVLACLAKYLAKDGLWKGEGVWASAQHISAATWWKGLCGTEILSPIASIILQIPPTSASCERNLSLFGSIHTKVRNRLTNAKVEKLVSIRSNLILFESTEDTSTQLEVDFENDEVAASSSESDDLDDMQIE